MIRLQNKISESKTRGQSLAEYGLLITVVTVALLAMQLYMKRGIQGVIKYSTDQFGNQEYMETDPEKVTITHSVMQSIGDNENRFMQEGTASGFMTTLITDMNTTTTGNTTYWKAEEL